jgi:hypothetical protein
VAEYIKKMGLYRTSSKSKQSKSSASDAKTVQMESIVPESVPPMPAGSHARKQSHKKLHVVGGSARRRTTGPEER